MAAAVLIGERITAGDERAWSGREGLLRGGRNGKVRTVDLHELYQDIILDHSRHPRHHGECPGETHRARAENPNCGDEVTLHLRVVDGRVVDASFTGQGCALSQASASLLLTKVCGRPVAEVPELVRGMRELMSGEPQPESRLDALGDLAALQGAARYPQRVKCVNLAWHALEDALATGRPDSPA